MNRELIDCYYWNNKTKSDEIVLVTLIKIGEGGKRIVENKRYRRIRNIKDG